MYAGKNEIWISSDKRTKLWYDQGADSLKVVVDDVTVAEFGQNGLQLDAGSVGYGPGNGGAVLQAASKSTPVALNKPSGQVNMNNAALAAGAKVVFTINNTLVAATDIPTVVVQGGGTANAYRADVVAVAAGSFAVMVENTTGGSLSESPVIGSNLGKGANS